MKNSALGIPTWQLIGRWLRCYWFDIMGTILLGIVLMTGFLSICYTIVNHY